MYFIYFIKVAENIKIGICKATLKNLKQRLSEANRWSPNSEILGVIYTENKDDEKKLHIYFKEYQITNEVFSHNREIIKFIKRNCTWTINKRFISYSYRTIKCQKIKHQHEDNPNRFKYRNNNAKPSVKMTWQQWAKLHELETKLYELIEGSFHLIDTEYNEYGECCGEDYKIILGDEIIKTKWDDPDDYYSIAYDYHYPKELNKHPELSLIDFIQYEGGFDDEVLKIELPKVKNDKSDDSIDNDFTGIGDEGFHYVDGYFNICDPLGIESY